MKNNWHKDIEAPKDNESKFVRVRNAEGLLKFVGTTAKVNGEYYLIKGTSFSNVVSAIKGKYEPLLNNVFLKTKNWDEIKNYISDVALGISQKKYWEAGGFIRCEHCGKSETGYRIPKKMSSPYRIQKKDGTFLNAGTDFDSWFTLDKARKLVKYDEGQRIIESDGVHILWETF